MCRRAKNCKRKVTADCLNKTWKVARISKVALGGTTRRTSGSKLLSIISGFIFSSDKLWKELLKWRSNSKPSCASTKQQQGMSYNHPVNPLHCTANVLQWWRRFKNFHLIILLNLQLVFHLVIIKCDDKESRWLYLLFCKNKIKLDFSNAEFITLVAIIGQDGSGVMHGLKNNVIETRWKRNDGCFSYRSARCAEL